MKCLLDVEQQKLIIRLYKTWCHNAASTLTLCLIAECYDHAYELVRKFTEKEVTVDFLSEIEKFVSLLESPIFTGMKSCCDVSCILITPRFEDAIVSSYEVPKSL